MEREEGNVAGDEGDQAPGDGDEGTESSSDSDSDRFIETEFGNRRYFMTNTNTLPVSKFVGDTEQIDEDSDADFDPTEDPEYSALVRTSH